MRQVKALHFHVFYFYFLVLSITGCVTERDAIANHETSDFEFEEIVIAENLKCPWGMAFLPDGRMLVTERDGELLLVEDDSYEGKKISGVPEVFANNQGGLLDVQLHPNYEQNGWIYFSYSKEGEGGASTAIMRARLEGQQLMDNELLFEAMPKVRGGVHFGSRIAFDKDGFMFFSVGERGTMENAQKLENDHGKIHRLKDDGSVPEDNPFLSTDGARASIWSYGHRNPQGMVYIKEKDELWIHEHGPKGGDELNLVKKGLNYGWPVVTYGKNYDGTKITDITEKEGMEQPVHYWVPSIAPCGMARVSSDRYPAWKNDFLIGSLSFRYLHRAAMDGQRVSREEVLMQGSGRVRHIAQSPDGFIYVAIEGPGRLVKLMPKS